MLLSQARDYALRVLEKDPELTSAENVRLERELRKDKRQIKDFSKIS